MAPMEVLIVGLGAIGQRHARNLRALLGSGVVLSAYRARRLPSVVTDRLGVAAGADVEREYGLQVYGSLDAALAQAPRAVIICNPTRLHMPVALSAARAGAHLFVEKPLSHDLEGVEELAHLAAERHLVTLVGYSCGFTRPCCNCANGSGREPWAV